MTQTSLFLTLFLCFIAKTLSQHVLPPRNLWCVAKNNAEDQALQSSIDWACGAGGANCGPIQEGGACYDSSDVQTTASWAFNDYYLKNGLTDDACSFSNTAALTSLNPSHGDCKFPSSLSVSNATIVGTTSTSLGTGMESGDLSGGNKNPSTWIWPFVTTCLVFLFTRLNDCSR